MILLRDDLREVEEEILNQSQLGWSRRLAEEDGDEGVERWRRIGSSAS